MRIWDRDRGHGGNSGENFLSNCKTRLELVPSETLPRSTQAARSVLAVSRGARESALRMLSGKISFADRGILRFNAKRDTVSVVGLNYGTMNTVADQAIKCPSITCIRNLGIEIRNTSFRSDFPRHFSDRLDYLFRFLLRFRSLETLSLVTMPMPGDPDTVKFVRVIETEEDDEIPISLLDRDLYEIMPDDSGLPRWAGELVRGENGLSDWYCRTPTDARWGYVDRTEITHLDEVLEWRDAIESYGRSAVVSWGESGTSEKLKSLVKSLDVQVMTHFREGVEPPEF
ncbi:hypothetical protein NKR23_g12271 [Pleurostoma richardsiae]|uniref:Uncharacterized protein n=1 Tax=Pleurostoma richardsiae TaxID=41990 RepID=A0AA38R9P0_9PEZI|nr:hypothetical protein NKR23_g12271 [Pleurostoma richardsiae]